MLLRRRRFETDPPVVRSAANTLCGSHQPQRIVSLGHGIPKAFLPSEEIAAISVLEIRNSDVHGNKMTVSDESKNSVREIEMLVLR